MTFVKICGITNLVDALAAVEAGADALGFNFYKPSPRYIAPSAAREIIAQLPGAVLNVGVFVNESTPQTVIDTAEEAGVTAFQLHGDESPEYCQALSGRFVIKTLSVDDVRNNQTAKYNVDAIMIDAGDRQTRGGTGRVVDWSVASQLRASVPKLFLAGGLGPENIEEAIRAVEPYAVDACSSLEKIAGQKNHDRMKAFIEKAHSVKP